MNADLLTPADFGVARNGIHLHEVPDGDQWFAFGHHETADLAAAINLGLRAAGMSLTVTADLVAARIERIYMRCTGRTNGRFLADRCEQNDTGAVPVTVVTIR
ncbi:hypothetical protein [Nocardia tengchongensis]|uniref:hypothetical protein n=1 Tax=Nocardia tengchongensis TaxID=2055889 RepID=UPI00364AC83B